jgi:hypothetical protein
MLLEEYISYRFPAGISTRILHAFLTSPIHVACHAQFNYYLFESSNNIVENMRLWSTVNLVGFEIDANRK